jgi:hypothetical protein
MHTKHWLQNLTRRFPSEDLKVAQNGRIILKTLEKEIRLISLRIGTGGGIL